MTPGQLAALRRGKKLEPVAVDRAMVPALAAQWLKENGPEGRRRRTLRALSGRLPKEVLDAVTAG